MRAVADVLYGHAGLLLDEGQELLERPRQGPGAFAPKALGEAGVELGPARPAHVDRLEARVVVDRRRRSVGPSGTVRPDVGRADRDGLESAEDIDLRDRERREAVEARDVAQEHEVEPAAAPRAPGRRAALAADPLEVLLLPGFGPGQERPAADAGRVGLRDPDHLAHALRRQPRADERPGAGRVRARHERVRPEVDVQKRALRAFEEDRLGALERAEEDGIDVPDVRG